MWPFTKKSKEPPKPVECRHHWKDFPWYYEATYYSDSHRLEAKLIEPYVCIHCKERKNVVLKEHARVNISYDDANDVIEEWREKYKDHMEDRAIIEDMIHDTQLVDREYLAIVESLANPVSGLEAEMEKLLKSVKLPALEKEPNSSYIPPASVKKATT